MATSYETVVLDEVIASANSIGGYSDSDETVQKQLRIVASQMILKSEMYIGRALPKELTNVIGEMCVRQYLNYAPASTTPASGGVDESLPVKKLTRGDYSVEYDVASDNSSSILGVTGLKTDIFGDYEWILKKYKKLKVI